MKNNDSDTAWLVAVIVMCMLLISAGKADANYWIETHLASKHSQSTYFDNSGTQREYNEVNLGMGIMLPISNNIEVGFGGFKNSYSINTYYTGFDLHTNSQAPVRYGISAAIMTGYEDTPTPTRVMILPNLTIGNQHVRLKIGVIPGPVIVTTFTLGVKF